MVRRADLMGLDFDRIAAALAGLLPSQPMTVKSLVRAQLSHIEDARRRGVTHEEIAAALTEAGCPIMAATLRKYLSQLQREMTVRRPAVLDGAHPRLSRTTEEAPTALPRRSLRRSTLLSSENKV